MRKWGPGEAGLWDAPPTEPVTSEPVGGQT
jgi:hypothetical protein